MSRTRMFVWTSCFALMAASLCAVALLELLARAAPARVVAPDLLGRLDAPLLHRRRDLVGRLDRVAVRADARARAAGRLGQRARLRRPRGARVGDLPRARRAA